MADELSQTSPARLMSSTQRTLSHEAFDTMQPTPDQDSERLTCVAPEYPLPSLNGCYWVYSGFHAPL